MLRSTITTSVTSVLARTIATRAIVAPADGLRRRSLSSTARTTENDDDDRDRDNTALVRDALSRGPIPYTTGWAWQQASLHRRLRSRIRRNDDDDDEILLFEHEPVYTLGRGADENHLAFLKSSSDEDRDRQRLARASRGAGSARLEAPRSAFANDDDADDAVVVRDLVARCASSVAPVAAPNGVPVYRVERGGEVTHHGPGQLVVYPLLDLRRSPHVADLHDYLRKVEEVVIRTLADEYDVTNATRDEINTGVWVNEEKVAAVGVSASRWITTHGLAINVNPDLSYFDTEFILPCGIEGRGVTSLKKILTERGDGAYCPSVKDVAAATLRAFEDVFGVDTARGDDIVT